MSTQTSLNEQFELPLTSRVKKTQSILSPEISQENGFAFENGDAVIQPAFTKHNLISCNSDNLSLVTESAHELTSAATRKPDIIMVERDKTNYALCCCDGCQNSTITHQLFPFPKQSRMAQVIY